MEAVIYSLQIQYEINQPYLFHISIINCRYYKTHNPPWEIPVLHKM